MVEIPYLLLHFSLKSFSLNRNQQKPKPVVKNLKRDLLLIIWQHFSANVHTWQDRTFSFTLYENV
jgi:hypothetical protein